MGAQGGGTSVAEPGDTVTECTEQDVRNAEMARKNLSGRQKVEET